MIGVKYMIDEKKLIEDIEKEIEFAMKCNMPAMVAGMRQIASVIEEQPKISEWIPCSERLPEMHREDMEAEGEYYMISNPVIVTDGKQIYIAEYEEDMDYRYGWRGFDGEDYDNIIAWMPLPNPYRPEEESE